MTKITPTLALEYQDELMRWSTTKQGIKFWEGWYARRKEAHYPLQSENGCGATRAIRESNTLRSADTYFVSSDMARLAEHAARSMPDQPVIETDLPSQTGFVVFETPIVLRDINGIICSTVAFSWLRDKVQIKHSDGSSYISDRDVISLTHYSDWTDERDEYLAELKREGADYFPIRFVLLSETLLFPGSAMIGMDAQKTAAKHNVTEDVLRDSVLFGEKLPLTLWALMNQRLPAESVQLAERHARRRLARAGSPLAERSIRVITLRRPASHHVDAAGGTVDWSHRWMVSGHWRNQWVPTLQTHRLQWIAPYVKGPDDKPLVIKRTVRQLVR